MTDRLQVAENFLMDATGDQLSSVSRENLIFGAGYLYAIEAIPSSFAEKLEHPTHRVIRAAARCLGLEVAVMEPALTFIREQYSPGRDGRQVGVLVEWALLMKKVVAK